MKKPLLVLALAITMISAIPEEGVFTGRIDYKYSFTDLQGNDITESVALTHGREQHYFVNVNSYKSYDETNSITQLYDGTSNTYYGFWKDKTSNKVDALTRTSQQYIITKLDKKETILGYKCIAIQVETDDATTVYYYSPLLRIDYTAFSKHNFGDWNRYLEATNGALSLKYMITDHKRGYIWTIQAEKITKMPLMPEHFEFPKEYTLRN